MGLTCNLVVLQGRSGSKCITGHRFTLSPNCVSVFQAFQVNIVLTCLSSIIREWLCDSVDKGMHFSLDHPRFGCALDQKKGAASAPSHKRRQTLCHDIAPSPKPAHMFPTFELYIVGHLTYLLPLRITDLRIWIKKGCLVIFFTNFLALMIKAEVTDGDSPSSAAYSVVLIMVNVMFFLSIWWNTWATVKALFSRRNVQVRFHFVHVRLCRVVCYYRCPKRKLCS